MNTPFLKVENVSKVYSQGLIRRRQTFKLEANFTIEEPTIVGMMGPNGSGKTTLFELITGSNQPTSGRVLCHNQDVHRIRYDQRDRLAIHYHQSYQVRRFHRTRPNFMLQRTDAEYPLVHLFDEPQFNTQDGYIGFMLDFFRRLQKQDRLVFLCVHPNERFHLDIMKEVCSRFVFVRDGQLTQMANFTELMANKLVRDYLGGLATEFCESENGR